MERILHIITGLNTGGAERALYNLMAGGLAERFTNEVICLGNGGNMVPLFKAFGVPVHILGIRLILPSPKAIWHLRTIVNDFSPSLIHGWMYHGNLAATLSRHLLKHRVPLSWNVRHSLYSFDDKKIMTRQIIRAHKGLSGQVDRIVYNSSRSRFLHERYGLTAFNGQVIPNGFDLSSFRPGTLREDYVRRDLGIPINSPVVGHIARLHPMKDHSNFLRCARRIARSFRNVHFVLVGRDVVPEQSRLTDLIDGDLKHRFHLLGERADIPSLARAFDIFCQSSWTEAFPNVLGEAMASAVPCVATDVGDSAEIIGDTGVVVPPRDDVSLAAGIAQLLKLKPKERLSLGVAARERIQKHYSIDQVVNQYTSLYEDLLDARS